MSKEDRIPNRGSLPSDAESLPMKNPSPFFTGTLNMGTETKSEYLELALLGSHSAFLDISFDPEKPFEIPDRVMLSPMHKALIGFFNDEFFDSWSDWKNRIHPDDLKEYLDCVDSHLRGNNNFLDCEYRILHRDGTYRWILSRGKITRNEQGIPMRWSGIDRDVTEKKQNEIELKRLAAILDSSYDAILAIDLDGIITSWNKGAERIYGYTASETIGQPITFLFPPERQDEKNVILESIRRGEMVDQMETVRVHKDGTGLQVSLTVSPICDSTGHILAATVIARDITGKKRAERALMDSEARYRSVVETAVDGIITINEQGHILTANAAVEKMLGYTVEELIGKNVNVIMPQPYRSEHDRYLQNYYRTGERKIIGLGREVTGLHKNGSVIDIDLAVSETRIGDSRIFTGIIHDISGRKKAERELKELNESLEQRIRERTRSLLRYQKQLQELANELTLAEQKERRRLANDLHDYLAQLLVACKLNISRVKGNIHDEKSEDIMEDTDQILNQALQYTRTLITELSPSILYEAGFIPALHWLAKQMKRQDLEVSITQDGNPFVIPNEQALLIFQAVRELLMNVVKHAQVKQAEVRLECRSDNRLQISILDEGRGMELIASDDPSPLSGRYGLFNIQERLKAIGGRFEIHSIPGKGTTSRIVIPLLNSVQDTSADPVSDSPIAEIAKPSVQILLVDDHDIVREGLRHVIDAHDEFKVIGEAADGLQAVEKAAILRPQIVIMDLNMPRMNGIEATRRIKQTHPEIKVIGLSVHDDSSLAESMMEAGASAYLTKGGPSEDLYNAILTHAEPA